MSSGSFLHAKTCRERTLSPRSAIASYSTIGTVSTIKAEWDGPDRVKERMKATYRHKFTDSHHTMRRTSVRRAMFNDTKMGGPEHPQP